MSYGDYTDVIRKRLSPLGIAVRGIHEIGNAAAHVRDFGAIYVGGGNTFLLLKSLWEGGLIEVVRNLVGSGSLRYMGSSAGTNVACRAINNTNDMPIVYPPALEAFRLIPFNINPHYLDPDPASTHKGETRERRIREFHFQSDIPVIGLREGSWLRIHGDKAILGGSLSARLFRQGREAVEMPAGSDLSFLLA